MTHRTTLVIAATAVVAAFTSAAALAAPPGDGSPTSGRDRPQPGEVEILRTFDPDAGEAPESVALDSRGTVYVSLALADAVHRRTADGTETRIALPAGTELVTGLAVDRHDEVHVGVVSPDAAVNGIWRIDRTQQAHRAVALPLGAFVNGLTFGPRGELYGADSADPVIYRVAPGASTAERWVTDPLLAPDPAKPDFAGANGVKVFRGALYVSNSARSTVLRVPIGRTGAAGPVAVHLPDTLADDFVLDRAGNFYLTTNFFNEVVRVSTDGRREVLADASDGLDGPTAVAFGTRPGERSTLYISNAAFTFASPDPDPSLARLRLGAPGHPLGR